MLAKRFRKLTILAVTGALSAASVVRNAAAADTVVQVNVDSVIDGRTVSTVANGTVTVWTVGQGVDGDGNADGFVTNAVEAILATQGKTVGGKVGVALPDDGMFPADARHPAIALHFSNAAPTTSPQTHQVYIAKGAQSFQFNVPQATYSKMFLLITASEGAAALTITLTYTGGTAPTVTKLMLPDYGIGGAAAGDPVFFNLIAGMRKWSSTDVEGDSTTHTITGIELNPMPTATLAGIQVAKTNGSHVVFWGATGIATSAVTVAEGGTGDASGAPDSSAGGAGGAGGTSTTGGDGAAGTTVAGDASVSGAGGSSTGAGGTSSGAAGTAGQVGSGGSGGSTDSVPASSDSGCACSLAATHTRNDAAWIALGIVSGFVLRRRRPS
jgi:MYXO-CTERM domain-containing protein